MGNRRLPAAVLCFVAVTLPLCSPALAESNPAAVQTSASGMLSPAGGSAQRAAAEAGLTTLIGRSHALASAFHPNRIFDIAGTQGLDGATLGDGFETYLVDPKLLLSGKRLGESLYGSGEWRFIVVLHGKGIGLITVVRVNSTWTMVEAGASQLAAEIASIAAEYAQQAPEARLRFVRSPQAVADFMQVWRPDTANAAETPVYVPLASARTALFAGATGPITAEPALSDTQFDDALRESVRRGMRDPRVGH
jgi:hypothetical protein